MKLSICLHQFFHQYLPYIKGAGHRTVSSYKDAFALFLRFTVAKQKMTVKELELEHLTPELIFAFLNHLENHRHNSARTRNSRLAAIKSLAKMIRLLYPQYRQTAERILKIPQKRYQKKLIGFLTHDEVIKGFDAVELKKKQGFRDYTLLHLLYDSGARASEICALKLKDFDPEKRLLAILGKANRYRLIQLWPKTTELMNQYIQVYRPTTQLLSKSYLFVNQRKQPLTRHGINRICSKYLRKGHSPKRLETINPAHSFRHSCAVNMLLSGCSLTEIKNHLGHEHLGSTMVYLHLSMSKKREVQKRFIEYTQSTLKQDRKINDLLDWENKEEFLNWLDSL